MGVEGSDTMFGANLLIAAALLGMPQHSNMSHAAEAMGFDQNTTRHTFAAASDGGSIAVDVRDAKDTKTRDQIRMHLRHIASAFKEGDFSLPILTHSELPPGADVMAAKKDAITYTYSDSPHGGIVKIRTTDAQALEAVHAFLTYQNQEHNPKS